MSYLKKPTGQRNVLIIAIVVVVIFFKGCGGGISDVDKMEYEQNISALQDSVRTYTTKNGTLVFEKKALLGDVGDIGKLNKELKKEMKDLKDNPIVVTKFKTKIVHDTVRVGVVAGEATFAADGSKTIPFSFDTTMRHDDQNYRTIAGKYDVTTDSSLNISSSNFTIDQDEIGMSFTTGITENDDKEVEIFIKSDYPGFTPSGIDGAIIDPTKSEVIKSYFPTKRWGFGPYVGYGLMFNQNGMGQGVTVGVSVSYDIFQWVGKK